jgi:hypothetical protein
MLKNQSRSLDKENTPLKLLMKKNNFLISFSELFILILLFKNKNKKMKIKSFKYGIYQIFYGTFLIVFVPLMRPVLLAAIRPTF